MQSASQGGRDPKSKEAGRAAMQRSMLTKHALVLHQKWEGVDMDAPRLDALAMEQLVRLWRACDGACCAMRGTLLVVRLVHVLSGSWHAC